MFSTSMTDSSVEEVGHVGAVGRVAAVQPQHPAAVQLVQNVDKRRDAGGAAALLAVDLDGLQAGMGVVGVNDDDLRGLSLRQCRDPKARNQRKHEQAT